MKIKFGMKEHTAVSRCVYDTPNTVKFGVEAHTIGSLLCVIFHLDQWKVGTGALIYSKIGHTLEFLAS